MKLKKMENNRENQGKKTGSSNKNHEIDKPLVSLTRKKRKQTKITNIRNKTGNSIHFLMPLK